MKQIKAILFDCDGTLIDSESGHYLGWKAALNLLGHDLTLEEYCSYVGHSPEKVAELLAKKIGYPSWEFILQEKRKHYHVFSKTGIPPISSTVDLLEKLLEAKDALGIKVGVCSASKKENLLAHLHQLGLVDQLDVILSGQDDLSMYVDPEGVNKPKPYIYLHAMKLLNARPSQTIVIEDSVPGVQAGKTAGCLTIAIPNDFTKDHDFFHAHLKLDSLEGMSIEQFFEIIQNLEIVHH